MKIKLQQPIFALMFSLLCLSSFSALAFTFSHDAKSAKLADLAVNAMGGRESYDNTRYLSWFFFGKRFHVWDKHTGNVRIEYGEGDLLVMNIHNKIGRVWEKGVEILDERTVKAKMDWGYRVWINDSYWVVMPYKLHDPGVTLTYAREDKTKDGRAADVVTMTFDNVGVTPENKYEVYFDKESHLVTAFAYFPKVADENPSFNMVWANWQQYGNIMLSDSRGEAGMGPIRVFDKLPQDLFTGYAKAYDTNRKLIPGSILAK